jgi:hypothetical protein
MKVRFEFTIDDLIDVGERSLSVSRVVTKLRRTAVVVWTVLGGVVAFAILPVSAGWRLVFALTVAGAVALVYPGHRKNEVKKQLRNYWRERLAGDGPFVCEVEVDGTGITTEQLGARSSVPWATVTSIVETADSVDISTEKGGLVVVRNRAFPSAEEKRRFIEFGYAHLVPPRL